ncbi:MAG: acyltransferase [Pseudomarimonas sp.]
MLNWLRGIGLLRHPELVRFLGERLQQQRLLQVIRSRHRGARVDAEVRLYNYAAERLSLGAGSSVSHGTILAFGDGHNGFGSIRIGERSWVGQYNNLRAGGGDVVIGNDCLISQFCTLIASHHSTSPGMPIKDQPPRQDRSGVEIGDDVWLGAGVVVTAGAKIGKGAVIGANAVVVGAIPDYEIWAGVPARRIGSRA